MNNEWTGNEIVVAGMYKGAKWKYLEDNTLSWYATARQDQMGNENLREYARLEMSRRSELFKKEGAIYELAFQDYEGTEEYNAMRSWWDEFEKSRE